MRHSRKKRLQATTSFRQSPNGLGSSSSGGGSSNGSGIGGDHLHLPLGGVTGAPASLIDRVRVKYRTLRYSKDGAEKQNESESEALISGDDDDLIIGAKGGGGGGGGSGSLGIVVGGGGILGSVGNVMQRTTSQSIQMA